MILFSASFTYYSDGSPVPFDVAIWRPGEPNNSNNEHFVHVHEDGVSYGWNDVNAYVEPDGFVCEIDANPGKSDDIE